MYHYYKTPDINDINVNTAGTVHNIQHRTT